MTLKTDTEIICLPLPEFFKLSNHVSECTQNAPFRGKKIQKFSDSPLSKLYHLCSNIVDNKTVTEMLLILKLNWNYF